MAPKLGHAEPPDDEVSSAGATRAERRRNARKGRWGYRVLIGFGALCVVAAAVWQINATLWTDHSQRVGHSLIERFLKNKALSAPLKAPAAAAGTTSLAACNATVDTGGAQGLLVIPKLGVTAPVLEGTEDAQLNVAVGHDTNSVWPGTAGNSVLDAHDVSYFQNIAQLQPGDRVIYESPCTTYVFKVQTHAVVAQGAPVYNTPEPSITLVTCWPTNALWFTPNRYVVSASEVSSTPTKGSGHSYLATSPPPTLNVPADLAAQGVSLATYSLPMGTLTVNGTPDQTWANTPDPLLIQGSGVQGYIAAVKALTQNQLSWWQGLAPGIKPPAPLIGANNPKYLSPLEVTLTAAGSTVTGLALSNTVAVSGGNAPGHYVVSVTESVVGNALAITSWTMTPPGQAPPAATTTPPGTAGSPSATTAVFDAGTSSGWAGTEATNAAAYDTAAINGAAGFTPTGTVTYQLFANGTCAGAATSAQSVTIAAGAVPNSAATAPLATGTYSYLARYSGDDHYEAISASCEPFTVQRASRAWRTSVVDATTNAAWAKTEPAGTTAFEKAHFKGDIRVAPEGRLTFALFHNGTCTGRPASNQTVNLYDGAVPNAATTGPLGKGKYSYLASYQGDVNYLPSVARCAPFTVAASAKTS